MPDHTQPFSLQVLLTCSGGVSFSVCDAFIDKVDYFCDFLFAFLHMKSILKNGLL